MQKEKAASGRDGDVQIYPVNALLEPGVHVGIVASRHSKVMVERELIAGQQPMSRQSSALFWSGHLT